MKKAKQRASIYCRTSGRTEPGAVTLRDQRARCEKFAARQGWTLAGCYTDDGKSGGIPLAERPQGAAMLAGALAGQFEHIVVNDQSRLTRDTRDFLAVHDRLAQLDVAIWDGSHETRIDLTDAETEERSLTENVRDQYYRKRTSKRVRQAFIQKIEDGILRGPGRLLYGLQWSEDGTALEHRPDEVAVLNLIYALRGRQWSLGRIVEALNGVQPAARDAQDDAALRGVALPVTTRQGTPFCDTTVGDFLNDRRRMEGKLTITRKRVGDKKPSVAVDVPFEPMMTKEQYDFFRATARKNSRAKGPHKGTLLCGLLRCGNCGEKMYGVSSKWYVCKKHEAKHGGTCDAPHVDRERLERIILHALIDGTSSRDRFVEALDIIHGQKAELEKQRRELRSKEQQLTARRNTLEDGRAVVIRALAHGSLTEADGGAELEGMVQEIKDVDKQLAGVQNRLEAVNAHITGGASDTNRRITNWVQRVSKMLRGWHNLDHHQQRDLLRMMIAPDRGGMICVRAVAADKFPALAAEHGWDDDDWYEIGRVRVDVTIEGQAVLDDAAEFTKNGQRACQPAGRAGGG